ncbi:hypothetical protein LCGC14_1399590 [marine sediment metagenome]|uniref:ParB-like N-terminal domain-containing protein n=1 Tax=marine sediment metagenome TaxID=412755 RepID=A0A0F9MZ19_9ZZZZ
MLVPIKTIKVSSANKDLKRSRRIFGDVNRLAESIREFGLIHPVCVDTLKEPEGNYLYILIAGERRMRATVFAGFDKIAVTFKEDTTAKQRKAMELEENVNRLNMTWEEEVECLNQLHEIKQDEHGVATHSRENVAWGVRETARLLGRGLGSVGADLKLAKDLNEHPELREKVRKLPKVAAKRYVSRLLEAEELRKRVADKGIDIKVELVLGDCEELIDHVPDRSINCLLTDPPFAQPKIVSVGRQSYNLTETNVSDVDTMLPLWSRLIPKLKKKLVIGAHVYIFTSMGIIYSELMRMLAENGFLVDDLPLIWFKMRPSVMQKDFSYISCYEAVIFGHYLEKKRRLMKPVKNVLDIPAIAPQKRVHPLQRPDDVLRLMIENSTNPGELILDCFAGSGSTLKVARDLQRQAIGFELDADNYTRALNWLQETA